MDALALAIIPSNEVAVSASSDGASSSVYPPSSGSPPSSVDARSTSDAVERAKISLVKKRILSAKRAIADVETSSDITGSSLRKLTKTHKELNLALEQLNLLSREFSE